MKATFTSTHYVEGDFNRTNPGLFVSHPVSVGRLVVGAAYNSHGKTSLAVGAQTSYSLHRYVRVSISAGVATGYGNTDYDIGPKGLVLTSMQTVAIGPPDIQMVIMHVPGAVVFGLRVPVGR